MAIHGFSRGKWPPRSMCQEENCGVGQFADAKLASMQNDFLHYFFG